MVERRATKGELWGIPQIPPEITVNILMPNGLIIDVSCCREDSLEKIKRSVWIKAEKEILFRLLGEMKCYIFIGVTQDAMVEEFIDENRRLCDLNLFTTLLKLIESQGDKEEKKADAEIGLAIGVPLTELDNYKDGEVFHFRREITEFCQNITEKREKISLDAKLYYIYPPELDESSLDENENKCATKYPKISLYIWFIIDHHRQHHAQNHNRHHRTHHGHPDKQSIKIQVPRDSTSSSIIVEALYQILKSRSGEMKDLNKIVSSLKDDYILKACGIKEYLLGNHPLFRYKYITNCLSQKKHPQLMLTLKRESYEDIERSRFLVPSFIKRSVSIPALDLKTRDINQAILSGHYLNLWKYETHFKIRILLATYVNVRDVEKIFVRCGLYHGGQLLCPAKETASVDPWAPKWNQEIEFDLCIADLPRAARLSVSICSIYERKCKTGEHCPLAYGNLPLFDYKSRLLAGRKTIHLWPVPKDQEDLLNPYGLLGSNCNKDSTGLEIEFVAPTKNPAPIVYPPDEMVRERGLCCRKLDYEGRDLGLNGVDESRYQKFKKADNQDMKIFESIIKRHPLYEMNREEKNLVWRMRDCCSKTPDSLPKLLNAVYWNFRDDVSQLYLLLKQWGEIKPDTALELLGCKYADPEVRNFAVMWLDKTLSDELLSQYLLQLVQVMKFEPYYDNGLSRMLLKRALLNRRIGHYFFWHLKSEMHEPFVKIRFCVLLEAYCRGICPSLLRSTLKQVEALDKLTMLSEELKRKKDDNRERIKFFFEQMQKEDYIEALEDFPSPLNYTIILGKLKLEECRIMDSAKKPLWLVWSNPDPLAELHCSQSAIIFKSGDDLRQDMLTLQVIRIFDLIWRNEGHDLRMLPYTCLATGKQVGMIEVVPQARTIMNIQRNGGRMAAFQVDSTQLHKWIKDNNPNNYDQAIDTFTNSCAGYCVATFTLGIGDRNPDNIMVNEDGQIFHIDFGHFLGHFKKKFGINRERVPFVLTEDFLCVISKGSENPKKSKEFEKFTKLCGEAYLALRKRANLLITLFTMMLSTGIPELESMEDIGYLRKTLQVDKSDEEAIKYFNNQFFEAHGGAWTTKIDWFFHNIAHFKN